MNKPKISVVLPIYNVELYIEECLDSILNQSIIEDIEVLMIDDGSTDNSKYIIEKYALDYDNFYAYHKENEGSAIARNYGIELSKGEFIHFFDPDDYIETDFYEKLYKFASSQDYDFVITNFLRFSRYNMWEGTLYRHTFKNIDSIIESTNLKEMPQFVWDTGVWNKLIKKDFLDKNSIRFPNENISGQDIVFTLNLHYCAHNIGINPNIYYYWRARESKNSITQQKFKIKSFNDRIRVIKLNDNYLNENNVEKEICDAKYFKWLNHDLKIYIKKIKYYSPEYLDEKIYETKEILKKVPKDIKESVSSYKQIIYKMVEEEDMEGLFSFAHLEEELQKNPKLFNILDDKYKKYINLEKDGQEENLKLKCLGINCDEENLTIDFSEYIPYIPKEKEHNIFATLINTKGEEYSVEYIEDIKDKEDIKTPENIDESSENNVNTDKIDELYEKPNNKKLIIPIEKIKELKHSRVKVNYESENLLKESFIKNNKRTTFVYDNFDIDIGIGINKELYIDFREKNNNKITITEINKIEDEFILKGNSDEKINNFIINNVVRFDKIKYSLEYYKNKDLNNDLNNDSNNKKYEFNVKIPFKDLLDNIVKKWEIGSEELVNSIKLSKNFAFYTEKYRIQFRNVRNKVLIEIDLYDSVNELNTLDNKHKTSIRKNRDLNKEIKKLNNLNNKLDKEIKTLENKNKKLEKKTKKQKEIIEDYKSRKVVKLTDSIKKAI